MIGLIIKILLVLACLGGLGIIIIGKKRPHQKKSIQVKYGVYLLIITLIISVIYLGKNYYLPLFYLIMAIGFGELVWNAIKSKLKLHTVLISVAVYAGIIYLFTTKLLLGKSEILIITYFIILIFDAFSQISGQLFGKKAISKISPSKTWGGLIGGFCVTLTVLLVLGSFTTENYWYWLYLYAVMVMVSGFIGDLLASWFKRICGIKDYSNLIPGHGGVLDRFDSLLATGLFFILK